MSLVEYDPGVTRIKICGLSTPADVQMAMELQIDAIGLVFYPPSPRLLNMTQAFELSRLHQGQLQNVALVVDADDHLIKSIKDNCLIDIWQFHGDESAERCAQIAGDQLWIKAARIDENFQLDKFCLQYRDASAWILDALVDGYGGGGKTFNWDLIPSTWIKENAHRVVLSGGLNAHNVAEAISHFRPLGVDVSSGVEISKGKKDPELMRKFVMQVKQTNQSSD
jgi:phosphoribosylanthranilate isomerase